MIKEPENLPPGKMLWSLKQNKQKNRINFLHILQENKELSIQK